MRLRRVTAAVVVALCVGVLAGGSAFAAGEEIVVQAQVLSRGAGTSWIDPAAGTTEASRLVTYPTCLLLINYDEDPSTPFPEGAASFPTVSADGLTYTFTIASGHRFSDGEAVTAASFERAIVRARNVSTLAQELLGNVSTVTAAGSTLTITLTARTPDLVSRLGTGFFCAAHSSAPLASVADAPLPAAGPYYIDPGSLVLDESTADPNDLAELVLLRNANYGGTRTRNLGTIRWRPLGAAGPVDYIANPGAGFTIPAGMTTLLGPTTFVEALYLRTTAAPFSNVDVRRAAAFAVVRNSVAASSSYAIPLAPTDAFVSPLIPGGVATHGVYPLEGDPATGSALLGGATPAVTLCTTTGRADASARIETHLEAAGFDVTRELYSGGAYFGATGPVLNPGAHACDALYHAVGPIFPDAGIHLSSLFDGEPRGQANYFGFSDASINSAFDAAAVETSESARVARYATIDRDVAGLAPAVALGFVGRRDVFSDRIGCADTRTRSGAFALNRLCIEVSQDVPPGGTATTGGDATPAAPLQTSVTVPGGGEVTITQGVADPGSLPAFSLLDQQLEISAPYQTVDEPLVLTFELDASVLAAAGTTIADVIVYRDGVAIPDCSATAGTRADPDPCVASRTTEADGDGVIVVRTSQASTWNFGVRVLRGPFRPVNPAPAVNTVKAGRTVPVKFSLGGNQGLDVLEDGYPQSTQTACGASASAKEVGATGNQPSGLGYDATTGEYTYHWRTQSAWKGTCRTLTLRFRDGSELSILFRFT